MPFDQTTFTKEYAKSPEFYALIDEIVKANNLHLDQGDGLTAVTQGLIRGSIKQEAFFEELKFFAQTDDAQTEALMKVVDEKILIPLRENIKKQMLDSGIVVTSSLPDKTNESLQGTVTTVAKKVTVDPYREPII